MEMQHNIPLCQFPETVHFQKMSLWSMILQREFRNDSSLQFILFSKWFPTTFSKWFLTNFRNGSTYSQIQDANRSVGFGGRKNENNFAFNWSVFRLASSTDQNRETNREIQKVHSIRHLGFCKLLVIFIFPLSKQTKEAEEEWSNAAENVTRSW